MMKTLLVKLVERKYETYLLSLLLLLFGQVIVPTDSASAWQHILVIQNVLIGLLLFRGMGKWTQGMILVLSSVLIAECLLIFWTDSNAVKFIMGILFSIYFLVASARIYKDVLSVKEVKVSMIAAVFSGFIMLGFIGSLLFTLVELSQQGSFSNLGTEDEKMQNLTYFSFVSLLTIGYGDIVPLTQLAKKTSILLGLLGNFYLTFVTAVIIGKYIKKNR